MALQFHPLTVQSCISSPLGNLRLAASPQGLAGLWFDGQRHAPDQLQGRQAWPHCPEHPLLQAAALQLCGYFGGARTQFALPLDLGSGTPFQQQVWQALLGVAHGSTLSYGALAQRLGRASAVRAVAAAVGRNPLSLVVPCHRVLGAGGQLTGYAGGLERKAHLLALESPAPALARPAACSAAGHAQQHLARAENAPA